MADNIFDTGVKILSPDEVAALANTSGGTNSPPADPPQDPPPVTSPPNDGRIKILGPGEVAPPAPPTPEDDDDPPTDLPKPSAELKAGDVNIDYKKLATVLSNEGLFNLPEDKEIESSDDIVDLMRDEKNKDAQNIFKEWKDKLPVKEQAFLGFREAGYDADEAIQLAGYQEFTNNITENSTSEEHEQMYRLYLETRGLDEAEINENIENAKDLNKLKDKALSSKTKVIKMIEVDTTAKDAATQRAIESNKVQQEQEFEALMSKIENTKEIIPGVNITPKMQQKIKDSMTVAVETSGGQQLNAVAALQAKDPEGFNVLLHYYAAIGMFNMDAKGNFKPDISKITTKAKTKAANSLIDAVTNTSEGPLGSGGDVGEESDLLKKLERYGKFNF